MELNDLKTTWSEASTRITDSANSKISVAGRLARIGLKQVSYPEYIGSFICVATAVVMAARFDVYSDALQQGSAIASMILLLVIALLSLLSLQHLKVKDLTLPHAAVLATYAKNKLRFFKIQRANFLVAHLLFVAMAFLFSRLFEQRHIIESKTFLLLALPLGYIVLAFYSRRVWKHYQTSLTQTQELLNDVYAGINQKD